MVFKCGDKTVEFRLPCGIYTDYSMDSATGKTYTCSLLNALIEYGRTDLLVVTYDDVKLIGIKPVIEKIKQGSYSLIFMDRANMYMTEELFEVLQGSQAIVYLDYKWNRVNRNICGSECYIDFTREGLLYYADDV